MALSREHNARAEMAGKGPSLDLLRVLLPMREAMDNVGRAGNGAASGVDKLTKAQELGVTVLDEAGLTDLLMEVGAHH